MLIPKKTGINKPENDEDGLMIVEVDGEEYMFCPVRKKTYKVSSKPEEKVRQWWLYRLKIDYGYSFDQIRVEVPVIVGSTHRLIHISALSP